MEEEKVAEQEVVLHMKKIWVILHSGSSRANIDTTISTFIYIILRKTINFYLEKLFPFCLVFSRWFLCVGLVVLKLVQ